jgi:hypothetical protein
MERCAYCNAETQMYEHGTPICVACSEAREAKIKPLGSVHEISNALHQELLAATVRARQAAEAFDEAVTHVPSGLPHPDGTQRIHNASRVLSAARKDMTTAHSRLNDYLVRGILPEDLERNG